jgi:CheY-like chemotaxis protein
MGQAAGMFSPSQCATFNHDPDESGLSCRPQGNAMMTLSDHSVHVLIVEDEFMIAMQLAEWVAARGWKVEAIAVNVAQALKVLQSTERIETALIDMNLNGVMADEVIDALERRGVPFVIVTGNTVDDLGPRFAQYELVSKPVHFDELAQKLQNVQR